MSAIAKPSFLTRLMRTRITHLLTGRLADGYTPEALVAASGLDASTRGLILDVVKRTKLWSEERADVTRELIAHFLDGRDAGVTTDKLIRLFGDPTAAAALIRNGKIRNRSLAWHGMRFVRRALGVFVLIYIGMAFYYSAGKPVLSVDYVAKLNEPILKVPEAQRAWPFYREFAEILDADAKANGPMMNVSPNVGDRKWPATIRWLTSNPKVFELLDSATSRPSMGFIYGAEGSVREMKDFPQPPSNPSDPFHNALIGVLLPQLNSMRTAANLLTSDARLAAEQGDAVRWMKRIEQTHHVAHHAREPGLVVNYLVQLGIEALRQDQIDRMLTSHPALLTDAQLAQLAHENAIFSRPGDVMSFETERLIFKDVVQRIYTDDGKGDGHLSPDGIANIQVISHQASPEGLKPGGYALARYAISPAAAMLTASRKDLLRKYDYFMDKMQTRLQRPWRERGADDIDAEIAALKNAPLDRFRYVLLTILLPSLDRAGITAERVLVKRDAVQIAIGLELYRRKTGAYPQSLADLAPKYLPSIPLDPCDGKPMRYKLVDGRPLIYSIGTDLKDDGGVAPTALPGPEKEVAYARLRTRDRPERPRLRRRLDPLPGAARRARSG